MNLSQASETHTGPRGLLSCRLDGQSYALLLGDVREIRSFESPLRVAGTAAALLGVIDLRGTIVPVLDLRLQLGMPAQATAGGGAVVIVERGGRPVGLRVDSVSDVLDLPAGAMRPLPALAAGPARALLCGAAQLGGELLLQFDLDALLHHAGLGGATAPAPARH